MLVVLSISIMCAINVHLMRCMMSIYSINELMAYMIL